MSAYAETFERVIAGNFEAASDEEKLMAVREVIQVASVAAAAVTVQPIPIIDMALIAPIQIGMVQAIGRIHGYKLDRKSVLEILSSFGAGLVTQGVLISTAKIIPIVGFLAAIPMAYALTWSVGEVAHYYFKSGRGVSPDELRVMFEKLYREKREERARAGKRDGSLKERLEDLVAAREAGLVSEEEFARKKQRILGDL
jgi:uncharacterized protein (DUF697 family)